MLGSKRNAFFLAATSLLPGVWGQPVRAEWASGDQPQLQVMQKVGEIVEPGKPFAVDVSIRNMGTGDAQSVHIYDDLPGGAELVDASPTPAREKNVLVWSFPALKRGAEQHILLHLRSDRVCPSGDWANKVRVSYRGETANTYNINMKHPRIELTSDLPRYALVGEKLTVPIQVKNKGNWAAHRLNMTALLTGGLIHESAGRDLENEIGDLSPGQSCSISLPLRANHVGQSCLNLRLDSDEGTVVHLARLTVYDARLELNVNGPTSVAAGWACTYTFVISNKGSEVFPAARMVAELPGNLTFVRANANGVLNPIAQTVAWDLPECKPGQSLTYVVSGTANEAPDKAGSLKILDNKRLLKETSWQLRLLDRKSSPPK